MQSRTEARFDGYGYGYGHWVHLFNGCKVALSCSVTTNVNPSPTTAELEAGEHKGVMTFMGSPARELTASVSCHPR